MSLDSRASHHDNTSAVSGDRFHDRLSLSAATLLKELHDILPHGSLPSSRADAAHGHLHFDNSIYGKDQPNPGPPLVESKSKVSKHPDEATHVVKEGESLWRIARNELGKDASNKEILSYVRDIAKANGMEDMNKVIHPDDVLKMPDHGVKPDERTNQKPTQEKHPKDDPGHKTVDSTGQTTRWDNGVVQRVNYDGTGYVRIPDGHGGYSEHRWGPQQGDNPPDATRKIENTGSSDKFQKDMGEIYGNLPDNVRHFLDQRGVRIFVSDRTTSVRPGVEGQQPRGWAPGSTYDDAGCFYFPDENKIVINERPKNGDKMGAVDLEHEVGHAIDFQLGNPSHRQEFKDAMEKGLARLSPEKRKQYEYFLQKGDAGAEESFGELFAITAGGHRRYTTEMEKDFPEAYQFVQKTISQIA